MSQMTEYFLIKDLYYLWQNKNANFELTVNQYKESVFPSSSKFAEQSSPDWNLDIGGLEQAKY